MNLQSICNRVKDESGWKEINSIQVFQGYILLMGYSVTNGMQIAKVTPTEDGLGFGVEYIDADHAGLNEKWRQARENELEDPLGR